MMQRKFRQVCTLLREQSCISYAKIATIGGFCDIDLIIIKVTSPDDLSLPEKYIRELLRIFSFSPSSFQTFSISFTRRFSKTHSWRVALKCLLLLHRLLRSVPESSPFRDELIWSRTNGLLSLHPCNFKDESSSSSEYYTAFIKSYAQLLDEALTCFSLENEEISEVLELLPQLQSLIDRIMDCRPTGSAARSILVRSAMKHIVRDSFICYTIFRREIIIVLDNLLQMPYGSCVTAFGIYKKAAIQANQLCEYYDWCRAMSVCGYYEYPFIDRIPHIQVQALEKFLTGMWQSMESSSMESTSPSSPLSLTENANRERSRVPNGMEIVVSTKWESFEDENLAGKSCQENYEEPLIQFEVSENDGWEALLEASLLRSYYPRNNSYEYSKQDYYCYHYRNDDNDGEKSSEGWKMQLYNLNARNPFYHPKCNNYSLQNNAAIHHPLSHVNEFTRPSCSLIDRNE